MVYSTESAKWKAYQFSDPFAAGSFFVCNKINRFFCRPDCDIRPTTNLKSEIKFVHQTSDALNLGFIPCEHCDPLHSTAIDVNLLIKCVATVNKNIGFMPPLLDDNEESNTRKIKENIYESKKQNEENIMKTVNGTITPQVAPHRVSEPILSYTSTSKLSKDLENTSLSKNDSDHYRLVDLACRHLALAAAVNVFQPKPIPIPEETNNTTTKKRRRRGGVLGFKELAAKSKLSAWHFHRVFKSVTGLTPKTYGDKCWEFIKKVKESGEYTSFEILKSPNLKKEIKHQHSGATTSPQDLVAISPTSPDMKLPPQQPFVKLESDTTNNYNANAANTATTTPQTMFDSSYPITPTTTHSSSSINNHQISNIVDFDSTIPSTIESELNNFTQFDANDDLHYTNKAFSFPDLSKFRTDTLFNHTQPLRYNQYQSQSQSQLQQQQPQQQQQQQQQAAQEINANQQIFTDLILPSSTSNSSSMPQFGVFEELNQGQDLNLLGNFNPSNVPLQDELDFNANNFDDSIFNSFVNPNNFISAGTNDDIINSNDYLSVNPQLASSIGL